MPSGQTDLCNLALNHIGMQPIQDISDNNDSAIACQTYWNPSRDDIFSEHKWGFASAQDVLVLVPNKVLGWCYIYAYPSNCARVWNVYNCQNVKEKEEQEFEAINIPSAGIKVICSNNCEAYADFTYIEEDPTLWDPKFGFAFSYRLAASIAKTLTGDDEIAKNMMTVYNGMLNEAKRVGFAEKKKKPNNESGYVKSRNGDFTGRWGHGRNG